MRSSAVFSLAVLAAATVPSIAAPISSASYEKRANPSQDESNALSLGAISTIASVAAPVVNGIINHFKDKRELEEILARADGESGAFKIAPGLGPGFHSISHIPYGGPFAPRDIEELLARADEGTQSGAFLGSLIRPILGAVGSLFGNKREFDELMARANDDPESGALLGSLIRPILGAVGGLFGNKREFDELMARANDDPESGAFLGAIARLIPTAISAIGNAINKREFEELLARITDEADDSGTHSLFSGNKRDFEELLARYETSYAARSLNELD